MSPGLDTLFIKEKCQVFNLSSYWNTGNQKEYKTKGFVERFLREHGQSELVDKKE